MYRSIYVYLKNEIRIKGEQTEEGPSKSLELIDIACMHEIQCVCSISTGGCTLLPALTCTNC